MRVLIFVKKITTRKIDKINKLTPKYDIILIQYRRLYPGEAPPLPQYEIIEGIKTEKTTFPNHTAIQKLSEIFMVFKLTHPLIFSTTITSKILLLIYYPIHYGMFFTSNLFYPNCKKKFFLERLRRYDADVILTNSLFRKHIFYKINKNAKIINISRLLNQKKRCFIKGGIKVYKTWFLSK